MAPRLLRNSGERFAVESLGHEVRLAGSDTVGDMTNDPRVHDRREHLGPAGKARLVIEAVEDLDRDSNPLFVPRQGGGAVGGGGGGGRRRFRGYPPAP
jgi:hypothetical protein